jgi:hypothetical protein
MTENSFQEDPSLDPAQYRWQVEDSFAAEGKPHLIFKCRQAVTKEDGGVLRTEMFTLISLMIWRMRRKSNAEHEIIPVSSIDMATEFPSPPPNDHPGPYGVHPGQICVYSDISFRWGVSPSSAQQSFSSRNVSKRL